MNKHPEPLFQKRNFSPPGMINFANIFITPPKTVQFDLGVAGKEILTLSALCRSCQFLPLSDRTTRHSQFVALLCVFPELISLQESCGSRFRLISRLFGCLKCLLLLIVHHIPEIRNDLPSLIVKVAKSFCKNTKYCSAI